MAEMTDRDAEVLGTVFESYIGERMEKARLAFRVGAEVAPHVTVTGPKRLPRKLKKRNKKLGIALVEVSFLAPPTNFIEVTVGFQSVGVRAREEAKS